MSMRATAQREQQVSSAPIDLDPAVRAESIDLRALISHRSATPASASVESVAEIFKSGNANFVAVLEGQRLLGMCSRKKMQRCFRAHLKESTESLLDAVVGDVYKFGDSTVLTDDACLVTAEL